MDRWVLLLFFIVWLVAGWAAIAFLASQTYPPPF